MFDADVQRIEGSYPKIPRIRSMSGFSSIKSSKIQAQRNVKMNCFRFVLLSSLLLTHLYFIVSRLFQPMFTYIQGSASTFNPSIVAFAIATLSISRILVAANSNSDSLLTIGSENRCTTSRGGTRTISYGSEGKST